MRAPRTARVTFGDGYAATLTAVSPRLGLRAIAELTALLGPAIAGLISGAGVRISDTEVVPWEVIAATPSAAFEVLNGALRQAGHLSGDRLLLLVDALVIGHCRIEPPGGDSVLIEHAEQLDALVPDPWALIAIARTAAMVSLRPTSAGGDGSPS